MLNRFFRPTRESSKATNKLALGTALLTMNMLGTDAQGTNLAESDNSKIILGILGFIVIACIAGALCKYRRDRIYNHELDMIDIDQDTHYRHVEMDEVVRAEAGLGHTPSNSPR